MVDEISRLAENLKKSMEHAVDWEKRPTEIDGIFIVKMPKRFELSLEFNPPDDLGNASKRRGLYFRDIETVESAKKAFFDARLGKLIDAVRKVNGDSEKKSGGTKEIFKI